MQAEASLVVSLQVLHLRLCTIQIVMETAGLYRINGSRYILPLIGFCENLLDMVVVHGKLRMDARAASSSCWLHVCLATGYVHI